MPRSKKGDETAPDSNPEPPTEDIPSSASTGTSGKQARTSWTGGSWRGKATAVAHVAKESITRNSTPSEIVSTTSNVLRNPSQRLSQSLGTPGKSKASPASATPLHVTSDAPSEERGEENDEKRRPGPQNGRGEANEKKAEVPTKDGSAETKETKESSLPATAWRGWWTRPRQDSAVTGSATQEPNTVQDDTRINAVIASGPTPSEIQDESESTANPATSKSDEGTVTSTSPEQPQNARSQRSSWFGLWGSGAAAETQSPASNRRTSAPSAPLSTNVDASREPSQNAASDRQTAKTQLTSRPASGSWAFWSRERPPDRVDTTGNKAEQKAEVGELAVSGTDSQSKPRPAQLSEETPPVQDRSKKRQRPESSEIQQASSKKKTAGKQPAQSADSKYDSQTDQEIPPAMQQSILRTSIQPQPSQKTRKDKSKQPLTPLPPNAIFPSFASSYPAAQPSSYLSRLSRYIPYMSSATAPKHLYISPSPHRIRRALTIGVHGYFPTALIQKFLGPPTGTSIKFADSAAAAIQQYCALHAYNVDVEKVALEGEGTVDQRIESLWKLLLNWIDAIRKADLIIIACHSQGVPVAVGLVARLLSLGCVGKDTRIGICAMAGVNSGPFPSYQSRFLPAGSSAAELFQFAQPNSPVSTAYTNALNTCFRHHVRVLYVGSLDDQLVSLESSTFSTVSHPYISRAVFIDGREHPSSGDFLTRLVGFALKLQNRGIEDHGLIRELSGPLAGSLYSGGGHSRIYEETGVYDLAVRLAVETETLDGNANPSLEVKKAVGPEEANPFFLPWALRGVLEEEEVKRSMGGETEELLGLFERWRPQSKMLRDVRFRLEAVRSKL